MKSILIFNPESGHKNIVKKLDFITQSLSKKYGEIECKPTSHAGHATEIADTLAETVDYIFVAGGDGTINEVVNGLAKHDKKPILGILPTGTANDVAHSVGTNGSVKKSIKKLLKAKPIYHDIFQSNQKFGIYVCCAGLFTKATYQTERKNKKRFGILAYFVYGARELFCSKSIDIKIKTTEETIHENCSLFLAINSRSVAGFRLNRGANINDGLVDVVLLKCKKQKVRFIDILHVARLFLFGIKSVKDKKYVTYRTLQSFEFTSKDDITINLDGEKSDQGSFDFKVHKNAIQILSTIEV